MSYEEIMLEFVFVAYNSIKVENMLKAERGVLVIVVLVTSSLILKSCWLRSMNCPNGTPSKNPFRDCKV